MPKNVVTTLNIPGRNYTARRQKIFLKITLALVSNSAYAQALPGALVSIANDLTEAYMKRLQEQRNARVVYQIGRVLDFLVACYSLGSRARRSLSFTFTFWKSFFTYKSKTHGQNKGD